MTLVNTKYGSIEGESRGEHAAFRGIPFARPPVGTLRFAAPEAPVAWSSTRAARAFSASAMQGVSSLPGMSAEGALSEDCLYLNVFTPAADRARRPVLFWIHGGAFVTGSGSMRLYDGSRLCERGDVVVVTINYRLGALGYLYLGQHGGERMGASANVGQLDQIAALRWVRDNIEQFGGDPDNVTIFGESAGSMAVCALVVMPAAKGLFHRAIAQSGSNVTLRDGAGAAKVTDALLAELGMSADDAGKLRDLPAERIVAAQAAVARVAGAGLGFTPVVDGATLPYQPGEALRTGSAAQVPLMIGTNRDELNLFMAAALRELDKPMSDERAFEVLSRELPQRSQERIPPMLETYRGSRAARGLPSNNRALLGAIQTDFRFRMPSIAYAEAHGTGPLGTFMYLFTYESPAMRGALRACHALEIPFVFGTLDAPFQDRFVGKGPAVEALSATMMDAWLAFARGGDPSTEALGTWSGYEAGRRATMVFDRECAMQDAPFEEERASWDGVFER